MDLIVVHLLHQIMMEAIQFFQQSPQQKVVEVQMVTLLMEGKMVVQVVVEQVVEFKLQEQEIHLQCHHLKVKMVEQVEMEHLRQVVAVVEQEMQDNQDNQILEQEMEELEFQLL